jgi:hypothetical protein
MATNTKTDPRWLIIRAANHHIVRTSQRRSPFIPPRLLGMRQIQQAVCVARRNRLIEPTILAAAGFRAKASR